MANVLADMLIRMGVDSAELRAGLKTVESNLNAFTKNVGRMRSALEGAFVVVGVQKAAAALGDLVKSGADAADQIGKLAQKAGLSAEAMSGLAYAAKLGDIGTEELGGALAKLSKTMGDAAEGGKAQAATFKALGVSWKDAQGNLRPVGQVLEDVADAFAAAEDGPAKAALAMELFGRSGATLIPWLNGGAKGIRNAADEAERFGFIVSDEAAKAGDEFNDSLDRLKSLGEAFAVAISTELTPALVGLSQSFLDSAAEAGAVDEAAKKTSTSLRVLSTVVLGLWEGLSMLDAVLSASTSPLAAVALAVQGDWESAKNALKDGWDEVETAQKKAADRLRAIWEDGSGPQLEGSLRRFGADGQELPTGSAAPRGKLRLPAQAGEAESAIKSLEKTLTDLQAKAAGLNAPNKFMGDIAELGSRLEKGDLAKQLQAAGAAGAKYRSEILSAGEEVARLQAKQKALDDEMKAFGADVDEFERLWEKTRSPAEAYSQTMSGLGDLLKRGVIDQDLYARAVRAAGDEYFKSSGGAAALADEMRAFNDLVDESVRLTEEAQTPTERYAEQIQHLQQMLAKGAIDPETAARLTRKYQTELDHAIGKVDELAEAWRRFGEGSQGVLEDQLVNGFNRGLRGMLEAFGEMLRRMLAQAAAARLSQALLGGFADLGKAAMGWFGSVGYGPGETADVGGFMGLESASFRAAGGPVTGGAPYIIGEKGPELFVPRVSGQVISNEDLSKASGAAGGPQRVEHVLRLDERSKRMTVRELFEELMLEEAAAR